MGGAALLSACAVAATCAGSAGATGGSSTAVAPSWSAIQPYQTSTITGSTPAVSFVAMVSVTCPSYGSCVAAGMSEVPGGVLPVIAIESKGQWGAQVTAPLPANAQADSGLLTSVSCSSASSCVAVGSYQTNSGTGLGSQPLAVPFTVSGSSANFGAPQQVALPSGALTTSSQGAFLTSISCAAACTAVGTYENSSSVWTAMTATQSGGGAWSATAVTAPAGATQDTTLNAISCPSSGACEVVGGYGDASGHLQSWVDQVSGGAAGAGQAVTVPDTRTITASTPTAGGFLNVAGLTGVSCPSAGACTAIGSFNNSSTNEPEALVVPITQGSVGSFTSLEGVNGAAYASSISCWDAADCVAATVQLAGIGGGAAAVSEVAGSWAAPVTLQDSSLPAGTTAAISLPESIACSSPDVCVTTGIRESETGSGPPSGTLSEGSFFAYSAVPPTIGTSSLPAAKVGVPYTATLVSSGGAGDSSWSVTAGSLPAGLTLDAGTGVISGTPKASGQTGFVVSATNAGPPSLSAEAGLSITVGAVPSVHVAYSKVSGRSATLVLSCTGARCAGRLRLTDRVKRHTWTLASGHYSVNAGSTKVMRVRLNRRGVRLLRASGRLSAKLMLTPNGAKKAAVIKVLRFRS